jgi:hypothetical protein
MADSGDSVSADVTWLFDQIYDLFGLPGRAVQQGGRHSRVAGVTSVTLAPHVDSPDVESDPDPKMLRSVLLGAMGEFLNEAERIIVSRADSAPAFREQLRGIMAEYKALTEHSDEARP